MGENNKKSSKNKKTLPSKNLDENINIPLLKTLGTIFTLIIVYPVGVIFMWFLTGWNKWIKILVTLPLIFIIFILFTQYNVLKKQVKRSNCVQECINNGGGDECVGICKLKFDNE